MALMSCLVFVAIVGCANANSDMWNDFPFPYDTQLKEWQFLHQEPEITLHDVMADEATDAYDAIYDLITRVLGDSSYASQFSLQLIDIEAVQPDEDHVRAPIFLAQSRADHPFWSQFSSTTLDMIELDNDGTRIILRGTSTIALAVAFNWYLEEFANTTYDWRTYTVDVPSSPLPLPPQQRKQRSLPLMYHQNVCTVSYSFAFFDWDAWQKHIDWMAMQGINLPLAFNGQEYVWAKTFAQFGLNTTDLASFFAGPAFYAWQRMGNIQGWGGPLREEEIMSQYNLQLKILARMSTFGMTPALTCFAGHVPQTLAVLYPDADMVQSSDWAGFPAQYTCVTLLSAADPLFFEIGRVFIEVQTKYFGASHVYQCDSFNEMTPPSSDADYLQSYSRNMYDAMQAGDEDAVWLMQGWLFINQANFWNNVTVPAFLSGVPDHGMIILDLMSESSPVYQKFNSYFGKPFIWNALHNFGGKNGLGGNLPLISNGFVDALNYPNTSVVGIGTTMEGIWQNYIVYSFTYKMGYETQPVSNFTAYAAKYAHSRYGLPHSVSGGSTQVTDALVSAWVELVDALYEMGDSAQTSIVAGSPGLNLSHLDHDPMRVQSVWRNFVSVGDALQGVAKFRYDLVDVTRQAMTDLFNVNYQEFNTAFARGNLAEMQGYGEVLLGIAADLDEILLTDIHWMLGDWIDAARAQTNDTSNNNDAKNWYEFNARMQITLWGYHFALNNYAEKQWGDIIGTYYAPQWRMFVNYSMSCVQEEQTYSQAKFNDMNYESITQPWSTSIGGYHQTPVGDTISVACKLYKKWNLNGDESCVVTV